jgi:hypothetical protein
MNKEFRGAIVGIGGGIKSHLSAAIVSDKGMSVREAYCGSAQIRGFSKSRTYGTELSEQSFPYTDESQFEYGTDEWQAARRANWRSESAARKVLAAEFLTVPNACQKCLKRAQAVVEAVAA